MGIEHFTIIRRGEMIKHSEEYEKFNEQIKRITTKTEQIKEKYGVSDAEMSSFSPDLLPTNKSPAILSSEVFTDYTRMLEQTNADRKEHNFVWFGKKQIIDNQECYSIEKAVIVPEDPTKLQQSSTSSEFKLDFYNEPQQHEGYDIIVDGHTHPIQDPTYADFNKLPPELLNELSLKRPGENFSTTDLNYYGLLLDGKYAKDKIIIGAVLTYAGKLLTIVPPDKNRLTELPTTIRQISAEKSGEAVIIPTSEFAEEQSKQFFGNQ